MIITDVPRQLQETGRCMIQTSGISMEPMLHDHSSSVILEVPKSPLKKMDVVLFQRHDGALVLHRLILVRKDICVICGDNSTILELVPRNQVLGVMTGFYPDAAGRLVLTSDPDYRRYVRAWWLRFIAQWLWVKGTAMKRRIIRLFSFR